MIEISDSPSTKTNRRIQHSPIEIDPIMPLMASISRLYPALGGNMIARMSRYSDRD
jgi:hypothetical protein